MRLTIVAGLLGIGWLSGVAPAPLLAGLLYLTLNSLALPLLGRQEHATATPSPTLDAGQMSH